MRPVKPLRDLAALFLALLLLAGLPLLSGCGGKEEPAGPEAGGPTARPGDEAPAVTAPSALSAMQFMPDGAQVAVGIPPVNGILAKAKAFSEHYGASGMDPQSLVDEWTAGLAMELNVPGATTMGEIAGAKGVNFDAPMAAFFDFRPALDAAAAEARQTAADRAEPEVDLSELSGAEADNAMEDRPAPVVVDVPDPEPRWVGVVQSADLDRARETFRETAVNSSGIPDEPVETVQAGGVDIVVYDPDEMAYFISGDFVVFGNDLELLKASAERAASGTPLRYGSKEFPALAEDELVALMYPGRYLEAMEGLVAALPADTPEAKVFEAQMTSLESVMGGESDEPVAASLVWDEERLLVCTRMDTERFPGMLDFSGKPSPFRLLSVLPEDTLAFLGIRFTDEFKKQAVELLLPAANLAAQDDVTSLVMTQLNQVIELLGDELAAGITRLEYDFPSIYIMMGLKDVEQARVMLQLFVPSTEVETHNNVKILAASGNMPVPVNYALTSQALLVSNDVDGLKAAIDRLQTGEKSDLLDNVGGDFSNGKAYYSGLYVDDTIFSDVVLPVADLMGASTPSMEREGRRYTDVIDEISMTKGMQGKWMDGRITIRLKPAPAPADATASAGAGAAS